MFSLYNDAWFMNESLAFYLSTSTFSNPVFNDQQALSVAANTHDADSQWDPVSPACNGANSSGNLPGGDQEEDRGSGRLGSGGTQWTTLVPPAASAATTTTSTGASAVYAATKRRCLSFRDSLAFSIKSKMYVLELNFKRRLQRLRRFADKRLTWMPFLSGASSSGRLNELPRRGPNDLTATTTRGTHQNHNNQYYYQDQDLLRSDSEDTAELDKDKFWSKIRPDSMESLGAQKERILSRLERALQAKRSGLANQKQQQLFNFYSTPPEHLLATGAASGCYGSGSCGTACENRPRHARLPQAGFGNSISSSSSGSSSISSSSSSSSNGNSGSSNGGSLFQAHNNRTSLSRSVERAPSLLLSPAALSVAATGSAGSSNGVEGERTNHCKVQNESTSRRKTRKPVRWSGRCTGWRRQQARDTITASVGNSEAANSSEDDESVKKLCIVCYTNSPNIVTLPCKHHEICSDCFIEIIYMAVKNNRYPLKCVLCRQKIEKIRCSRRLLLSVIEKNRVRP